MNKQEYIPNKDSEGEEFIAEFFRKEKIQYQRRPRLSGLKNDTPNYREPDFYLPKLKVYVEFLGMWHSAEARMKYFEKKSVYESNKIPCLYLYPDNLGILKFSFERKLKIILKEHFLTRELRRYQFKQLWEKENDAFVLIIICLLCLIFGNYNQGPTDNRNYIIFFCAILLYQFYRILKSVIQIYTK